jgi:bifunctional non-homologous end joining protein LigD
LHLDGLSFAVPKGVPTSVGNKVLAISTAYHPSEQARFEGRIPKGQYGAGTTHIVDEGSLEVFKRNLDLIYFQLLGETYRGYYYLKHWKGSQWLLWKTTGKSKHHH